MGAYPDGMQRLTLLACLAAALGALALPAVAAAPSGWQAGSGVNGSFTVLRAVSSTVALAGGTDGALIRTDDGGKTWAATAQPSAAGLQGVASSDGQTIYVLDTRGTVNRSRDGGAAWDTLAPAGGLHPLALVAWKGGHLLLAGRRSLLLSSDSGDSFESVTPKLARGDQFSGADRAGGVVLVYGSHALLVSDTAVKTWKHVKLPGLARGDSLMRADFVSPRTGFVLTSFRNVYRTTDAGHHWSYLVGTAGAGEDMSFSDARHGWLAAPGFANRFDGYVLHTTDGGATWRPQSVSPRFVSNVAATDDGAFAIADEGSAVFVTHDGGESGRATTVGFRPVPRRATRGGKVTIRGRIAPARGGVGVAVSMRSAGRWIVRYATTHRDGVFTATFGVQQRAWFIAQVATGGGHGSAATPPVFVPVAR